MVSIIINNYYLSCNLLDNANQFIIRVICMLCKTHRECVNSAATLNIINLLGTTTATAIYVDSNAVGYDNTEI